METSIYGKLLMIGTYATLKMNGDYELSFTLSKEMAIQLAPKLYKIVGLSGIAKADPDTYKIIEF